MAVVQPSARASLASSRAVEILRTVHAQPGVTRAELTRQLGMSSGLATETVARLTALHLLAEGPAPRTRNRGRPTNALGPHPDGPLIAVAAISHEFWEVATVSLGGSAITSDSRRHDRTQAGVLRRLRRALEVVCEREGSRIAAIVISVPGTVAGTRLVQAPNLGWEQVELRTAAPRKGGPILFLAGNDATLSAIAENRRGAAVGSASAVHLYMDSGIGGALLDGGQIVAGAHGRAGEFGHMPLGQRGARCRCGARGCWNTALDGAALARELGQPAPDDEVTYLRGILSAARAGGRAEQKAVRSAASALGRGAAALVNALDPELVTLGGLAPQLLEIDGTRVENAYQGGLMASIARRPPALTPSALGDNAPLIGAGEYGFDHILTDAGLTAWSAGA